MTLPPWASFLSFAESDRLVEIADYQGLSRGAFLITFIISQEQLVQCKVSKLSPLVHPSAKGPAKDVLLVLCLTQFLTRFLN